MAEDDPFADLGKTGPPTDNLVREIGGEAFFAETVVTDYAAVETLVDETLPGVIDVNANGVFHGMKPAL